MTISIIKQSLDIEELDASIKKFEAVNNQRPYLFMSEMTADILASDFRELNNKIKILENISKHIYTYRGCKCYEDSDLTIGEVKLR